jgi:o-succinylbenzoate synthase
MAGFELSLRRGFLLAWRDEAGLIGYGDAPLLPRITGTEAQALEEALLREGKNLSIQYTSPLPPVGGEGMFFAPNLPPEGRFGLSTARLDLQAKRAGISLARRLNPQAAERVRVNAAIGAIDASFEKRVAQAINDGFSVLKIKTAIRPWSEEGPQLARLIEGLPSNVKLRLDANRGWSPEETPRILAECANWPIEVVEEPCRYASFGELAALQAGLPFALALDESLPHLDRKEVLRACPTRRLIIKPAALGDLGETYDFAKRALASGLEVTVTSAVDTAIGVRAAANLAAALDGEAKFAHGLATSDWLKEDLAPPPLIVGGVIELGSGHSRFVPRPW